MVIKCEKTGKLFFSEAEAKLHSEETGMQDFAQVSLEEKIWICKETGKVCFNEQQIVMHKRFVPEAQTFDESTIGDLRKRQKEAACEGPAEMETEEEMLLRNAGLGGKASKLAASTAGPSGPPVVTKELVDQLLEMGFTELRAQKALIKTANAGVEPAINWLGEHLDDEDIDEPLAEGVEVKPQAEVDEHLAKAASSGSSQLTQAEKKAKLDEALAKARARKAGIDVQTQKEIERARRQGGKEIVLSLREQQEQQRKRDIEARKREKREFELERQKLREQLAKDKAEKIAAGLLVPSTPAPASAPAPAPEPAAKPAIKPKSDAEVAASAAAASAAGVARSYEEESLTVEQATEKMAALSDTKIRPALDLMGKMMANISKAPSDPKYRKMRLSNPKVAEGLVHVPGARQFLCAHGWQIVEREFIELPIASDAAAQAASQVAAVGALAQAAAAAQEALRRAEIEARKKEAAERMAKAKAEKEAIKAAMARDRGEVAARGPAQPSVAKKLPTEGGGVVKMNFDDDHRPGQGQ